MCEELPVHPNNLMASYIHMQMNRLFRNKQRQHEMVAYDFFVEVLSPSVYDEKI